ncbi:MAG: chemotaxis protein CheW [Proteobacteria bacterium]|nr:chemotaxis protein CheW [Pseudomonadota bacterium]
MDDQYLTFTLADELYGVDILKVQEIRGWSGVTQIPNCPPYIRGVVNLRGAIVPILDMRRRFAMEETPFTPYTVVIVVNVQGRTVGLVVDAVSDVVNLKEDDLRPPPDFGTAIDNTYLRALAQIGEDMVILLNVDDMLRSSELLAVDKIRQTGSETHA